MNRLVAVRSDDWCALYNNGKKVSEGHPDEVLWVIYLAPDLFPIEEVFDLDIYDYQEEVLGAKWGMPVTLEEVLEITGLCVPAEFLE